MRASENTLTDPRTSRPGFERMRDVAAQTGLDLLDPDDADEIVTALLELGDEGDLLVDVFHDYVHFRVDTDPEGTWDDAHAALEELLYGADELPAALASALEAATSLDPERQREAVAASPVVAGVRDLLEWIGSGKPVTASGGVRRSDISTVAAFLGISARGVAKLPTPEFVDGEFVAGPDIPVLSMWGLPLLAAWWDALTTIDLIELTPTRVRQGRAAAAWLEEERPPLDEAGQVAGVVIAEVLTDRPQGDSGIWADMITQVTIAEAIAALEPEGDAADAAPDDRSAALMRARAHLILQHLADVGLVERDAPGRFVVPELLRGVFAHGVLLALSYAQLPGEDDFDAAGPGSADFDEASPLADPEVRAEMARRGVVHKPGMAAELMREIAPLLLDEGIDVDDLDVNDLDRLNTALARATERRNLERFTPAGERRAMALTVHRLVAEALAEGAVDLAHVVIDGIRPDPVGRMPSVAHVIGVGLGALDRWYQDPSSARALARTRIPAWDSRATRAADDILRFARNGGAFDQLEALHLRHSGKLLLEGTLLAVAGSVAALAEHEQTDVREMASRVLIEN